MSDFESLLTAVRHTPDDDTPRLVLADWLDDNGNPLWAEFIRVQVELARRELNPTDDPDIDEEEKHGEMVIRQGEIWAGPVDVDGIWSELCRGLPYNDEEAIIEYPHPERNRPGDDKDCLVLFVPTYVEYVARRGFIDELRFSEAKLLGGDCKTCNGRGTVCEVCNSTGQVEHPNGGVNHCPEAYDEDGILTDTCGPYCESCFEKKNFPAVLKEIFQQAPIRMVTLDDLDVDELAGGTFRVISPRGAHAYIPQKRTPEGAWLSHGFDSKDGWYNEFSTEEAARKAVSDGLVAYGRKLAEED